MSRDPVWFYEVNTGTSIVRIPRDFVIARDGLERAEASYRRDHSSVCREAFRRVRRDVWHERESRLVAKWESYG